MPVTHNRKCTLLVTEICYVFDSHHRLQSCPSWGSGILHPCGGCDASSLLALGPMKEPNKPSDPRGIHLDVPESVKTDLLERAQTE